MGSKLTNSNIWNQSTSTAGVCIRADITGESIKYNDSIAFIEKILRVNFNLESDFTIENIVLEKFTPKEVEETEEFNVEACISDHNKCRDVKKLNQNEKFNVCVYATSPLIKISDILTMTMVQSNGGTEVVEDLVTGGKPNLFSTKIISDKGCVVDKKRYNGAIVSTLITSKFFTDNDPNPVKMTGNVTLGFNKSKVDLGVVKRRELKEVNRDETEEGKFELEVSLIPSTRTAFEATSEDDGIAGILTGAVLVLFVSFVVYAKKFKK